MDSKPEPIDDLREVVTEPSFLEALAFQRHDEHTADSQRWVWYERHFSCDRDHYDLVVQVVFELTIYDDVGATYIENCNYNFSGVYLAWRSSEHRSVHGHDLLGRTSLKISTLTALKGLLAVL